MEMNRQYQNHVFSRKRIHIIVETWLFFIMLLSFYSLLYLHVVEHALLHVSLSKDGSNLSKSHFGDLFSS